MTHRQRFAAFVSLCLPLLLNGACGGNGGNGAEAAGSTQSVLAFLSLDDMPVGLDYGKHRLFVSLGPGHDEPSRLLTQVRYDGTKLITLIIDDVSIESGESFEFQGIEYGSEVTATIEGDSGGTEAWTFVFSALPILQINALSIVDEPKRAGIIQLSDGKRGKNSGLLKVGIEIRGGLSQTFLKQSYSFRLEEGKKKLLDLRKDDDWILDGSGKDVSVLRNRLALDLFLAMRTRAHDKGGQPTVAGSYLELILNGEYQGIYVLSERVDRKLLDLSSKSKDSVIYKAVTHEARFHKGKDLRIAFEQKYPDSAEEPRFAPLEELVAFVQDSSDEQFRNEVWKYFDKENLVDWYLLILLGSGRDNLTKNFYLARHKDKPFFIVPWDHDACWGYFWEGSRDNHPVWLSIKAQLFIARLVADPGTGFNKELVERWDSLRENDWSEEALINRYIKLVESLEKGGAYARNIARWGLGKGNASIRETICYEYTITWIQQRLEYLDGILHSPKFKTGS